MFVGDEVLLDVGFAVARVRLANLARNSVLRGASEDACRIGLAGRLVRVHARELAEERALQGWPSGGRPPERAVSLSRSLTLTSS